MTPEQKHLKALDDAIAELLPLSALTSAPAPVQYQYLGTIVENTIVLLTAVANSLDQGGRVALFTDFPNWISAMQSVHRSFYSSIIIAVEISLVDYCRDQGIDVKSSRLAQAESIVADLAESLTEKNAKRILRLASGSPAFRDYLHAVVRDRIGEPERQTVWINFFDALTIVRNKASHSDVSLSESERGRLTAGGCGALVSSDMTLQLNSRNYKQVVDIVIEFYQEIWGVTR